MSLYSSGSHRATASTSSTLTTPDTVAGRASSGGGCEASDALLETVYRQRLCEKALERMACSAIRRRYEAEQMVFLEGDEVVGLYIVEAGWLKLVKISPSGREQVITYAGAGETFGEIAALTLNVNLVSAIALEPTTLWLVPRGVFLQLITGEPCMAQAVIQALTQRVLQLVSLVEDLSLRGVEARAAHLLLDLSDDGIVRREPWATQAELASRLGTVPRVLSRTLRHLSEEGLIQVERSQIAILDRQRLAKKSTPD